MSPEMVFDLLNRELPEGIRAGEAHLLAPGSLSPGESVASCRYRIPLPEGCPEDLEARIGAFLAGGEVPGERIHKGRRQEVDLRANVESAARQGDSLVLTITRGSPFPVAAYLLECSLEWLRSQKIVKADIKLKST